MLSLKKYLGSFLFLFLLLCTSCQVDNSGTSYKPLRRDVRIYGIYPKFFPCIGKEDKTCLYFTQMDGKIWFLPVESLDDPTPTVAYNPSYEGRMAIAVLFSPVITSVVEVGIDMPSSILFVYGVTDITAQVSFAVGGLADDKKYYILFGDRAQRNIIFVDEIGFFLWNVKNDRNIIFDRDENRQVEIAGDWGGCAALVPSDKLIEGVTFSRAFYGISYFVASEKGSLSEFVGWELKKEVSTYELTDIPSIYSLKIKEEAYPSVDSTRLNPNYIFGFSDVNTILFVSPSTPSVRQIEITYLSMTKKYKPYCSISNYDGKTYVFGSDGKNLLMFYRSGNFVWTSEKIAKFSSGELFSFIYNKSPCVIFTHDSVLRIACRIKDNWEFRDIDYGFIYNLYVYQAQERIFAVYNVIKDDQLIVRFTEMDIGEVFPW